MTDSIFSGTGSDWLSITQNAVRDGEDYFNAGPRREIQSDVRQFQGVHPTDSKYLSPAYMARSHFFRPKTRATIRRNEAVAAAALFSNTDATEVSPWDESSPIQRASASLNKELLNYRLKHTVPWFHLAIGGYQEAQVNGLVCAHVYWDTNKQKQIDRPWAELIPIENTIISPSASWFDPVNTSPYFIHKIPMLVKDVRARMDGAPGKTEKQRWVQLADSQILQAVQGYSDSIRLEREGRRPDPQAQPSTLTPYQIVWVYKNIADVDGVDYLWYTLGQSQLLCPGRPLEKEYWHGRRPYVMGYAVIEPHKIYPPGVARLTRGLQSELNENANQRSDNVKFAMNKRYFGKRGAQLDVKSLTRNVPSSVTLMNNPKEDVVVQETKDVTQSAYEEQDRLNIDFDELAGSNSMPSRASPVDLRNKIAGQEILTDDANQIEGYQLRTYVETFVEPVLTQIMLLEQHYETDNDLLVMCGKKATIDQMGVTDINDDLIMQELSLTVHVGIGATSPRKQLDNLLWGFAQIKELLVDQTLTQYGLDVEAMANEIFGKLGYRTADRFFKWDDQDPQITALQSQVQQLSDALKNKKDPPEVIAAKVQLILAQVKKTAAETFNVNVEGLFGSMQAGEVVAAVPTVAPVADTIARAAGYEPPVPAGQDPGIQPIPSAPGNPGGDGGVGGPQAGAPPAQAAGTGAPASGPAPGIQFAPHGVIDHRTGVGFDPSSAAQPGGQGAGVVPRSTDPLHPAKPAHPDVGVSAGIKGGQPRPIGGEPPMPEVEDPDVKKHRLALEMEDKKHALKMREKNEDRRAAKADRYDEQRTKKAETEAQAKKDKESADRHEALMKTLKDVGDRQTKLEEHIAKPKPKTKVVVKRDAKGNITSLEPQD